jgi:transcription elongation factor Elf1
MTFACPHCGSSAYRFLAGIDGKTAAECLKCGRASTFDQSMLSERSGHDTPTRSETAK